MTEGEVHLNIIESPQAGNRCAADRREHRPAARASRGLPPRHEALDAVGHASGRQGHPDERLGSSGRCGNRADGMVSRRSRAASHPARRHRLRLLPKPSTTYGIIGVKVWVFKGEVLEHDPMALRTSVWRPGSVGSVRRGRRPRTRRPPCPRPRSASRPGRSVRTKSCLQPKKTKYRKAVQGQASTGSAKGGFSLNFGSYGLKTLEPERITARQIEAARRAITRQMKRQGRVWIRVFPDLPVTGKPAEVRMGKGKGAVDHWAARVPPRPHPV